jgi:hypothetical protein
MVALGLPEGAYKGPHGLGSASLGRNRVGRTPSGPNSEWTEIKLGRNPIGPKSEWAEIREGRNSVRWPRSKWAVGRDPTWPKFSQVGQDSVRSLLRRAIQAISQVCTTGYWRPSSHVDVQGTLPVCT